MYMEPWNLTPNSKAIKQWYYIAEINKLALIYKSNPKMMYFYHDVSKEEMEGLTPESSIGSFLYNLTKTKDFIKVELKE